MHGSAQMALYKNSLHSLICFVIRKPIRQEMLLFYLEKPSGRGN